ncbi:GGDEF domain-containing protein [Ruminococcus flavefaciens]|uniref:substrate-binding and GGDEF domain-containing protein n=1 Tax=Ruminococcus flavefaciens TaxID=1265 RepID=UPI0026EF1045|nr:GGDEF domain-containing protein [Ruminococcus flavefaciens]
MDKTIEIAVIVAGIDEEYQNGVIDGIRHCAKMNNANISCFCAFGGILANSKFDVGEYNIYYLINYSKFDGVILMTNTISSPVDKEKIISKVKATGLPVTILDCDEHPEFYNISIDNYTAMQAIVRHVIEKHNVKRINYVSGPMANPEAAERYKAFCDTIKEYSIPEEYDRVYFGDFRGTDGKNAVDTFMSSGLQRPQAIICANDAMALAAVEELGNFGYKIPDDIIVTGFDNTYNARHHLPALTTVSRPLDDAGFKACEILIGLIIGREYPKNTILHASPVFSESCGCVSASETDISEYRVSAYKLLTTCKRDVSLLNRMTTELADTQDANSTIHTVSKIINEIKFDRFCLCLCSNWDQVVSNGLNIDPSDNTAYQVHGYTQKMIAPLVLEKNINDPVALFDSADMYPAPVKKSGSISFFVPLHFGERCLGYYIFTNSKFPTKSLMCHALMLSISNSIENIRKLVHLKSMIKELDKLYVIDPLCNIYNRNGFIRNADPMFKHTKETKQKLLISFIDMDGLKIINDCYGHNEGDFALQRLAGVISDCCKGGRICARFGGDEFIIIGENACEEDIKALETVFEAQLENINSIIKKPYRITASIGTIVSDIADDVTLFNLITVADEIMYAKKKRKRTSRYLRHTDPTEVHDHESSWDDQA